MDLWREHGGTIDLVLTDIVMPGGISGRQLAEKLHSEVPDLPIVYTSGYAAEAVSGEFQFREGENFLQKPYAPEMLSKLVRRTLDMRKKKRPSRGCNKSRP
jgi:DNA-binding NtrC family response regulator